MEREKREKRIEFSANDAEYKVLEAAARAAGIPVGTFCRMAAMERAGQMYRESKK